MTCCPTCHRPIAKPRKVRMRKLRCAVCGKRVVVAAVGRPRKLCFDPECIRKDKNRRRSSWASSYLLRGATGRTNT